MESENTYNCYVHFGILNAHSSTFKVMAVNKDNSQSLLSPSFIWYHCVQNTETVTVNYFL